MQLDFSLKEYEYIIKEAMLEGDERKLDEILRMKIKGYSRIKMAEVLNVSPETIDKRMKILKKKIKKIL